MGTIVQYLRKFGRSSSPEIADLGSYGQTGSGKSHTMVSSDPLAIGSQADEQQTGVEDELGVIPCAVDGVFDAINAVSSIPFNPKSQLNIRTPKELSSFAYRISRSITRPYGTCSISRKVR